MILWCQGRHTCKNTNCEAKSSNYDFYITSTSYKGTPGVDLLYNCKCWSGAYEAHSGKWFRLTVHREQVREKLEAW